MQSNEPKIIDVASLGMWLFLASEAMFFVALLGAFVVLQSTGQQHQLFHRSSQMLGKGVGCLSVILLVASSATLRLKNPKFKWVPLTAGAVFLCLQYVQWTFLLIDHTTVYRDSGRLMVSDGLPSDFHQFDLPHPFDIHSVTAFDFVGAPVGKQWLHQSGDLLLEQNYGPSRNNFFGSYFLMSAVHGLHLVAGCVAMLWFTLFRRGRLPVALQNYWHFVNLVGMIGFAALYFV